MNIGPTTDSPMNTTALTMSPEQQRIAIAEACGWVVYPSIKGAMTHPKHDGICAAPDYLNNLNAMHEAEKVLSLTLFAADTDGYRTEVNLYLTWLTRICGHVPIAFATAPQRAEAFLKTLGLWTPT